MKVIQMVGDGRPSGGTTVVLSLARDLAKQKDWQLHVVSQEDSYALKEAEKLGLKAHGVDFFAGRLNLKAVNQLQKLVTEINPDLIHVHAARAGFPLSFALPSKTTIPIVYTVHSYHFLGKGLIMRHLGALAEKRCHSMACASTFVCKYDEDIAREWSLLPHGAKTRQIYNGIEATDFPPPQESDGKTITFFGNLIYQKNPKIFVEMAAILSAIDKSLRFQMIGGGDLQKDVECLIDKNGLKEKFSLTGRIPREEALAALNGSHIMVMPSRWEGAPVVILEAMFLNVPIVGSSFPAMAEFLRDRETGLVVSREDPKAYGQAVENLLNDEGLRRTIVRKSRKMVEERFLRSVITKEYAELYESLLDGSA